MVHNKIRKRVTKNVEAYMNTVEFLATHPDLTHQDLADYASFLASDEDRLRFWALVDQARTTRSIHRTDPDLIPYREECIDCGGAGWDYTEDGTRILCPACNGTSKVFTATGQRILEKLRECGAQIR